MIDWRVFQGTPEPHSAILRLPPPPPWRVFDGGPPIRPPSGDESPSQRRLGHLHRARTYNARPEELDLVNAALYLRRPLLVTGRPGTGKSTLAYAVAHELALGPVLHWPITSRSTLQQGLYSYDAIGRLQEANLQQRDGAADGLDIGRYLRLGPLGTALLPYEQPRVLLIDEIDKSDVDLPNDLLNTFEEGEYSIPELQRMASTQPLVDVQIDGSGETVTIRQGQVRCLAFPFVVMTSNGEREFPPAFLRRCLRLNLREPDAEQLAMIVESHLGQEVRASSEGLIERFRLHRERGTLATDQLLNAIYLTSYGVRERGIDRDQLADLLFRQFESDTGSE